MSQPTLYQDVYFLILEEEGYEYLICLHANLTRQRSSAGCYIAHVVEPTSNEVIFFDCADELSKLRQQLDEMLERVGQLVFCYRDCSCFQFEWYPSLN
ncbi:hypothetical protein [Spirosoma endbachense]|uniref:Uncharacterized protein n=1 Tax=Spirosoma endbachense TaxID=2666025 RepID=A0A6P1W5S2_9BACT|nr:hypothetical protein [Spirosoma endbachense]QHV99387.1 hypothetical protein GJR95_32170 [Spirosoma endbachense]